MRRRFWDWAIGLGSIAPGKIANVIVTDGDIFGEKTKVKHSFVDGRWFEIHEEIPPEKSGDKKTSDDDGAAVSARASELSRGRPMKRANFWIALFATWAPATATQCAKFKCDLYSVTPPCSR